MPRLFADRATSTLAVAATNVATTLTLASGEGALFPSPGAGQWFILTLQSASAPGTFERVRCTSRSGDVLTVTRGQEGTTAQAWATGTLAGVRITASALAALHNALLPDAAASAGQVVVQGATTPEYDWPLPPMPRYRVGGGGSAPSDRYGVPDVGFTGLVNMSITAGVTYWVSFVARNPWTYDQIYTRIGTVAGTAGATFRMGLATVSKSDQLLALVREYPTVAADGTAGDRFATPGSSFTEAPGRYALLFSASHNFTLGGFSGVVPGAANVGAGANMFFVRGVTRSDATWPSDLSGSPFSGGQTSASATGAVPFPFLFRLSADYGGR